MLFVRLPGQVRHPPVANPMTTPLDAERLDRARQMAARLTDAQLAQELRRDRSALQAEVWKALEEEGKRRSKAPKPPVLTTTNALDRPIRRVLGVVGSEYVMGVDLIQEFLAGMRDIVGGRSETIQAAFRKARETLLQELSEKGPLCAQTLSWGLPLHFLSGAARTNRCSFYWQQELPLSLTRCSVTPSRRFTLASAAN